MTGGRASWAELWQSGWRAALVAIIAGAMLPLAFAPIDLYPLAVIAPAVLFWVWQGATPRFALLTGYLFGLGYFGLGVSWVSVSMYRFGGMGMLLSGLATFLFVLFLALFPALIGWFSRRYLARSPRAIQLLLALPALWVLLEWVRGWIFTGFPWLLLGYSHIDSPLAGLAPVLGVYGVSWAIALSAGLLVWVWSAAGRASVIGLGAAALLWLAAGLLSMIDWSTPAGEPLEVSLVQGNVPQELKWAPEHRARTIELYVSLSSTRMDRDIILWPETALPLFYHQAESLLKRLAAQAAANGGATLVLGLPVYASGNGGEEGEHYYNSVIRAGDPPQFYHKSHLVPFGEYIPLKSTLGNLLALLDVPMSNFSRGEVAQPLLEVAGYLAGVSICYEDAFGEEVIRGLPQANLLINVSNDAWFGDSFAPHQHLQMARMRTLEAARPMLRATNNGVSAIIDHRGQVQHRSAQFVVTILDGTVLPRAGATPYVRVGNWLIIALMSVFLLVAVALRGKLVDRKL